MKAKATLLIVDDEKNARDGLRTALEETYDIYVASDTQQAMHVLESETIDLVLTDLKMAGEDGLQLIQRTKRLPQPPACVLMTAYGSEKTAVEAMKKGADDYLTKPLDLDEVEMVVARHLKARRLEVENTQLRSRIEPRFGLQEIIGESAAMASVFDWIKQVAPSQATVLIQGESGGQRDGGQGDPPFEHAQGRAAYHCPLCGLITTAFGKRAFRPRKRFFHWSERETHRSV